MRKNRAKTSVQILIVSLIGGAIAGLIAHWIWVVVFSKACLKPPYVGEDSEELISGLHYQQMLRDNLPLVRDRHKAARIAAFFYNSSTTHRAEYYRSDRVDEVVSVAWVKINRDDTYLDQRDSHLSYKCWKAEIKSLRDGLYKSSAITQGLEWNISCPIVSATNTSVIGYISLGYTKAPLPHEREIIEDGLVEERILRYKRHERVSKAP